MAAVIPSKGHPRVVSLITDPRGQVVFALLTLLAILLFCSSFFVFHPYDGMEIELGTVLDVFPGGPAESAGIRVGDRVLTINGRVLDEWDLRPMYAAGIRQGDVVVYELQRGQQIVTLSATMGSYFDNFYHLGLFAAMMLLALAFWTVGLLLCLFVPPYDVRARLLGLGWLLAGTAMAAGGPGTWSQFWGAFTMMEVAWCCLAFVLVTSHLYFPVPSFARRRQFVINLFAAMALLLSALAVLDCHFLIPHGLSLTRLAGFSIHYAVYGFFLVSTLASVGLLIRNRLLSSEPDVRRQINILLWGTALGFAPFFALTLLPLLLFGTTYVGGFYTALFLVLIPLAYAYVVYQRRLLRVDFVINQAVVLFVFSLLVLTASILFLGIAAWVFGFPSGVSVVGAIVATLVSLPSAHLQRAVQHRVNRVLYGCHYDFSSVTSSISSRLAQIVDRSQLNTLLVEDLPAQMGVQQAALLLGEGDMLVLQQPYIEPYSIAVDDELCGVLLGNARPVRSVDLANLLSPGTLARWQRFAWAQLFVPIVFEGQLQGLLILGTRSSGDVYSDQDVHIIGTVAHQGALAYTNVQLVETLRGLARQLVQADEAQRKEVAHDLHDTVLQQLFFVKQDVFDSQDCTPVLGLVDEAVQTLHNLAQRLVADDRAQTDRVMAARDLNDSALRQLHSIRQDLLLRSNSTALIMNSLDDIIQTLRRTIKGQRPPLLDHGLPLALEGLVEEMRKVTGSPQTISWCSDVTGALPISNEQATALYRIAQEALSNALKHANAGDISVTLSVGTGSGIRLCIADDGVGMPASTRQTWKREHHYGLAGMRERAAMIGASFRVNSVSNKGTEIVVELMP